MSGLFRRKARQNPDEKKLKVTQPSDGSDSPRPFLLTSGCNSGRNPLDWAAMPSTLQNQFPHWKETSVPSPIISSRSPDRGLIPRPVSETSLKKFGGDVPEDSIPYIVMEKDTLVSIALKFDTTTSDIARINKRPLLASFPIYPGELLYIPDSDTGSYAVISPPPTSPCSDDDPKGDAPPEDEEDKGGVSNRQEEFLTKGRSSSLVEIEEEVSDTHVYVSSKFMSNQLCVHGYLVINTQSIMFKPNDEDPLVEDNGATPYEIWLPLQEIVYCYITRDYASPSSHSPSIQSPPPTVTHAPSNVDHTPLVEDHTHSNDNNETGGSHENVNKEEDRPVGVSGGVATSESPKEEELTLTNHTIEDIHDDKTTPSQMGVVEGNNSKGSDDVGTGIYMIGNESNNDINNEGAPEVRTEFEETRQQSVNKNEHDPSLPGQPQPPTNHNGVSSDTPVTNRKDTPRGNYDNPFPPPAFERSDTLNSLFQESYEQSISESSEDVPVSAPSPWFFLYCRLSQTSQHSSSVSVVGMKIPCGGGGGGGGTVVQAVRTWFIFAIPREGWRTYISSCAPITRYYGNKRRPMSALCLLE